VVPTLLLVAATKFTIWYPDHATGDGPTTHHGAHETATQVPQQ
jgi:hypothetical protein